MTAMPTLSLRLRRDPDGYFRTGWYDDNGQRHRRSFGRHPRIAKNLFAEFYRGWLADERVRCPAGEGPLTIREAAKRFDDWAVDYYHHADGTPTRQAVSIAEAMKPVVGLFGDLLAEEFGPKLLKVAREAMIEADWCVNVINQRVRLVRQVWRWLAAEELVSAGVWHGLRAVAALRAGRTKARSTTPVQPAPEADIWAVVKQLPPTVAAMVKVQYYTGARPGEVCGMRVGALDMSGPVWVYEPVHHKTAHHQRRRFILLGPKAQSAVIPFLSARVPGDYVFKPLQARRERWAQCPTHRHQGVVSPRTRRRIQDHYTVTAYAHRIRCECKKLGIPSWSPNRLRHNAATRLRKKFGLDTAQAVLGHAGIDVTQVYAELDRQKAVAAMEQAG